MGCRYRCAISFKRWSAIPCAPSSTACCLAAETWGAEDLMDMASFGRTCMQVAVGTLPCNSTSLQAVSHCEGAVVRDVAPNTGDDRLWGAIRKVGWHIVLHSVLACGF